MRPSLLLLVGTLALGGCASHDLVAAESGTPSRSVVSTSPSTTSQATGAAPAPTPSEVTPSSSPSVTPTVTPSVSASRTTTPTASGSTALVTGFGAVLADWATHHTADERLDPGAAWDPTPGWGADNAHDDQFYDVVVTGGRVLSYSMTMPRRSGQSAATSIAAAALPADATRLWEHGFGSCYVVQFASPTLGRALAVDSAGDPQGHVQVEFTSNPVEGGRPAYNARNVTRASVTLHLDPTPARFTGC